MAKAGDAEKTDLATRIAALRWYHSFDLPGGISTVGLFKHGSVVNKLPIPASLAGKRCLDVAASDGYWSFELARRGAAEVVSVDLPDASLQDYAGPPSAKPLHLSRKRPGSMSKGWTGLSTTLTNSG